MELVGDISSVVAVSILCVVIVLASVVFYKVYKKYNATKLEFDVNVKKAVDFLRNVSKAYSKPPRRINKKAQDVLVRDMAKLCQSLLPFAHMCEDIYEKHKHSLMIFSKEFVQDGWTYKFYGSNECTFIFLYRAGNKVSDDLSSIDEMILCIQGTNSIDDAVADLQAAQVDAMCQIYGEDEVCTLWRDKFTSCRKRDRKGDKKGDMKEDTHYPKGVEDVQFHQGFHDRTMALIDALSKILEDEKLYMHKETTIVCTGHSLGGAMANIMGMVLSVILRDLPEYPPPPEYQPPPKYSSNSGDPLKKKKGGVVPIRHNKVHVVTFGAPRCLMDHKLKGDKSSTMQQLTDFISAFDDALIVVRVQNTYDPVPHTPMQEMGLDTAIHLSFYFVDLSISDQENLSYCEKKNTKSQTVKASICEREPAYKGAKGLDLENFMKHAPFLFRADTHTMGEYVKRLRDYISQRNIEVMFKRPLTDCYPHPPVYGSPCFVSDKAIDVITDEEQALIPRGYSCMILNIMDHTRKLTLLKH